MQLVATAATPWYGIHYGGAPAKWSAPPHPDLARGVYLVRLEPGAAALAPPVFRHDVETALVRAGRDRVAA